ncbi:MAG: hypothetical protein IJP82_08205 [Bacteroidaceae bacterium]|nr:hypothetical protein [Bacteroidaceae bacterium]
MKRLFYMMGLLSLLCGCEHRPSLVEQRKAEIRRNDSLELVQALRDLAAADSVATFRELDVKDLKEQFVFEKQEKYQTVGYYVLPGYQGDKSRFTFFPEVEESGKLLLVSIDKKRRYAFMEIDLDEEDYMAQLPANLTAAQRNDIHRCYALAKAMHDFDAAKKQQEKMLLKLHFYEEKMERTH